jgi:hypothetical protein
MAKRSRSTQSITGRDDYIMSQALVIAIGHIQRLPQEQQAWSNMVDSGLSRWLRFVYMW